MKSRFGRLGSAAKEGMGLKNIVQLPVVFVIAGESLCPGDQVTVNNFVANKAVVGNPTGVVDPFLSCSIVEGDRFWLFLNPDSVNMLPYWEHPDFPEMEISEENS